MANQIERCTNGVQKPPNSFSPDQSNNIQAIIFSKQGKIILPKEEELEEKEVEVGGLKQYIYERFAQEAAFKASSVAREMPREKRAEYLQDLEIYAGVMIDTLKIDPSIFDDPRYCETFVAICDGFISNEGDTEEMDKMQSTLFETMRVLAGSKSGFNQNQSEEKKPSAPFYNTADKHFIEEKFRDFELYKKVLDHERTFLLTQMLNDFSEGSMFFSVRQKFEINSSSEELPYKAMVLNLRRQEPEPGKESWGKIISSSTAFVSEDPFDNLKPTIILPSDLFDQLKGKDKCWQVCTEGVVGHEYAHTQKKLGIGNNESLGRIWDEVMAEMAAEGIGYVGARLILNMMSLMLCNESEKDIIKVFKDSWPTEDKEANFYRFISDNFGFQALLDTLIVLPSPAYKPYGNGIFSHPRINVSDPSRMSDLLKSLFAEREKISPKSNQALLNRLKEFSWYDAKVALARAHVSDMAYPQEIQEILEAKKDSYED